MYVPMVVWKHSDTENGQKETAEENIEAESKGADSNLMG